MGRDDSILNYLHDQYMDGLDYPNDVREALNHLDSLLGHDTYREIEYDLSLIMDRYEVRGFKMGFKAGRVSCLSVD